MLNDAAFLKLTTWIMLYFAAHASPPPRCIDSALMCSGQAETYAARGALAVSYLAVAFDPVEAPVFQHGPHVRARTALRLAAIAAHESGAKPHLVAGQCWPGECPGGAVGPLQIVVPAGGMVIQGPWLRPCRTQDEHCIEPAEVATDHELGARVALRILRWGGLERYTGHNAPAITWIEQTSVAFLASHPPPVTDAAAMADADPPGEQAP